MEGYGFVAELWKGKKQIGYLEDYGDGGGVNANIKTGIPAEEREALANEVLADARELLDTCKAPESSLARKYWANTPYGAMECFGELLLELTELVKIAKKLDKNCGGPFAVIQTGYHWLDPIADSISHTQMMGFCLGDIPKKHYMMMTKNTMAKQASDLNISMLKFVEKPIKWSLSFKEYASMLETAREYKASK